MKEEKWVVEVEESVLHVWAIDREQALSRALQLIILKAYPKEDPVPENELVTKKYPSCIDQEVIDALTDQQLHDVLVRINDEINNRNPDTIPVPNYFDLKAIPDYCSSTKMED